MRLRLLLSIVALVAVTGTAEAGVRSFFKSALQKPGGLPKPIGYTSERVERSGVAMQSFLVRHPPAKYSGHDWGSRFDQIKHNYPPRPLSPPLRRSEY
jgi:hypothetical protein